MNTNYIDRLTLLVKPKIQKRLKRLKRDGAFQLDRDEQAKQIFIVLRHYEFKWDISNDIPAQLFGDLFPIEVMREKLKQQLPKNPRKSSDALRRLKSIILTTGMDRLCT
jgi:DNA polymerase elongation subunit (family B)